MFNRSKRSNVSGSLGVRVPSVPVNCIQRWAVGWTWCLFGESWTTIGPVKSGLRTGSVGVARGRVGL